MYVWVGGCGADSSVILLYHLHVLQLEFLLPLSAAAHVHVLSEILGCPIVDQAPKERSQNVIK